jgi:hypothetical protein
VSNPILEQNDIIKEISKNSIKNQWNDIGDEKRWIKPCPECGDIQSYNSENNRNRSLKLNTICRKCFHKNRANDRHIKENYEGIKFNHLTIVKQFISNHNKTFADCICDCGNKRTFELCRVKNNHIESCGCQRVESNQHTDSSFKRKAYGWSSFMLVYNGYKTNAKHGRGGEKEFTLSKEDAMKLFKGDCFYCGKEPASVKRTSKTYGEFVYNGIDRKDNNKGYTLDNCVSCCEFCNLTKSDTPYDKFLAWICQVYNNIEKKSVK